MKEKGLTRVEFPVNCPHCGSRAHLIRRRELYPEQPKRQPKKKVGTHWKNQGSEVRLANEVEYRVLCISGSTLATSYDTVKDSIVEALINIVLMVTPKASKDKARLIAESYARVTIEKAEKAEA